MANILDHKRSIWAAPFPIRNDACDIKGGQKHAENANFSPANEKRNYTKNPHTKKN